MCHTWKLYNCHCLKNERKREHNCINLLWCFLKWGTVLCWFNVVFKSFCPYSLAINKETTVALSPIILFACGLLMHIKFSSFFNTILCALICRLIKVNCTALYFSILTLVDLLLLQNKIRAIWHAFYRILYLFLNCAIVCLYYNFFELSMLLTNYNMH